MNGLTRALAKELGPRRITVNAVAPGLILNTPFHATFTPQQDQNATIRATPLQRAGNPDDVAAAVLYLASDASSFCTGTILDVNGGTNFR
jgi:3-oxoacyl-[acyl-carrier protein] reductase